MKSIFSKDFNNIVKEVDSKESSVNSVALGIEYTDLENKHFKDRVAFEKIKENVPAPNIDLHCCGHLEDKFTGLLEEDDIAVGANKFEEIDEHCD